MIQFLLEIRISIQFLILFSILFSFCHKFSQFFSSLAPDDEMPISLSLHVSSQPSDGLTEWRIAAGVELVIYILR